MIDDVPKDDFALFGSEHAALGFGLLAFVVGFDEREDVGGRGVFAGFGGDAQEGGDDRENVVLAGPADVDGDDADGFNQFQMQGIGAVAYDDAGVFPQDPCENAVGGVDGEDLGGTVLKQTVGEAADIGAQVGTGFLGDIDVEGAEGGIKLFAGAGNERPLGVTRFKGATQAVVHQVSPESWWRVLEEAIRPLRTDAQDLQFILRP